VTDAAAQLATHERRLTQHDHDIDHLHRDARWLRRAITRLMAHFGVEPPGAEEE
jgi:hypothetical protein